MAPRSGGERLGLGDDELAVHPTVFAENAFAGRTVAISGAAGGIGRAIAWLLGRLGARLILVGRKQDRLQELADALKARGIDAMPVATCRPWVTR